GYDSAGVAVLDEQQQLQRVRCLGKVKILADTLAREPLRGGIGIAHTRWATHGQPSERNAHPHVSNERIAVVHNGIIENYAKLRTELQAQGFVFTSDTDTEVIAHLVEWELKSAKSLLQAVQNAVAKLHGAYGMVILDQKDPERLLLARSGSPMVI